jgi:predicted CoA-binding protein
MSDLKKYCAILNSSKKIAVYGISSKAHKTSRKIAEYLKDNGYEVVGVNPAISKAGDIDVYHSLKEIPFEIDIVDVFRRSEHIPELIDDVLSIKPKVLWLQLGIRNDEAVQPVKDAGIETIQDTCIKVMHSRCKSN